jgi:hypothetical protein
MKLMSILKVKFIIATPTSRTVKLFLHKSLSAQTHAMTSSVGQLKGQLHYHMTMPYILYCANTP